jgi:nitrite reductase/ring-hydroxylating ferredoxin subunit
MAYWHRTLRDDEVGVIGVYGADAGGTRIILMRVADGLVAYRDACPHEGFPLSKVGERDGDLLICGKHLWEFDVCTGKHISRLQRPQCNLVRYPVRVAHDGVIEVDTDVEAPPAPSPMSSLM